MKRRKLYRKLSRLKSKLSYIGFSTSLIPKNGRRNWRKAFRYRRILIRILKIITKSENVFVQLKEVPTYIEDDPTIDGSSANYIAFHVTIHVELPVIIFYVKLEYINYQHNRHIYIDKNYNLVFAIYNVHGDVNPFKTYSMPIGVYKSNRTKSDWDNYSSNINKEKPDSVKDLYNYMLIGLGMIDQIFKVQQKVLKYPG